mgnify:CR=1 FL=1
MNIARYLNISRSHLYALFKQELNTSPQQFLTNAKIANARELLSKTKIPIYSVALSCGYKMLLLFHVHLNKLRISLHENIVNTISNQTI